jgi:hypothetical protein
MKMFERVRRMTVVMAASFLLIKERHLDSGRPL